MTSQTRSAYGQLLRARDKMKAAQRNMEDAWQRDVRVKPTRHGRRGRYWLHQFIRATQKYMKIGKPIF